MVRAGRPGPDRRLGRQRRRGLLLDRLAGQRHRHGPGHRRRLHAPGRLQLPLHLQDQPGPELSRVQWRRPGRQRSIPLGGPLRQRPDVRPLPGVDEHLRHGRRQLLRRRLDRLQPPPAPADRPRRDHVRQLRHRCHLVRLQPAGRHQHRRVLRGQRVQPPVRRLIRRLPDDRSPGRHSASTASSPACRRPSRARSRASPTATAT